MFGEFILKITFLLPPVNFSGGNSVVAIHALWLAEHGHDVTLISPPAPRISLKDAMKSLVRGRGWPKRLSKLSSDLDSMDLNHVVLDTHRPPTVDDFSVSDVIIATWWETAEWLMKLPRSHGAKVYFIQGHEVFDYLPKERSAATYGFPMKKIVVSEWLKDIMLTQYNIVDCKIVPNAVDHNVFFSAVRKKNEIPSIGFLYHEASIKGTDISLKVVERLCLKYPKIKIYSFGRSVEIKEKEITKKIYYQASPSKDRIRDIYTSCDVWLSTSRTEGFNLVAIEAMACRTPVVSTRTGWPVGVIIDGVNGYVADVDDVDGLFWAVCKIFDADEERWRNISCKAFETVKNASWDKSSRLFEQSLIEAAEEK